MTSYGGETPDWDALRDEQLARLVEEIRSRGSRARYRPTSSSSAMSIRTNGAESTLNAFKSRASMCGSSGGGLDLGRVPQDRLDLGNFIRRCQWLSTPRREEAVDDLREALLLVFEEDGIPDEVTVTVPLVA